MIEDPILAGIMAFICGIAVGVTAAWLLVSGC